MSDTNEETTTVTTNETKGQKKALISNEKVLELTAGIPAYDKASFRVVGHRNGVRLALRRSANGVGCAYFYGMGDYSLVPSHSAITPFTAEQRKERRLGGIMAEVAFGQGVESATEALALLVEVVRKAEEPAPKAIKAPKAPRKKPGSVEETVTVTGEPLGN